MSNILYKVQEKYIGSFDECSDELIKEMELYAREKRIPILHPESVKLLEQLIIIKKPRNVLEIGTAIAYSTIRIAKLLKEKSSIDTIEKSKPNILLAKANIHKAGLTALVNILEGDAFLGLAASPNSRSASPRIDSRRSGRISGLVKRSIVSNPSKASLQ